MDHEQDLGAALEEARRRIDAQHEAALAELRAAGHELEELRARVSELESELAAALRRVAALESSRAHRISRALRGGSGDGGGRT